MVCLGLLLLLAVLVSGVVSGVYHRWSDVTESIAILWVLRDMMHCCSDKNESVSLRKCPRDRWLTNRAYLSAVSQRRTFLRVFTYKMAAKINWHNIAQNYVTDTLCIAPDASDTQRMSTVQNYELSMRWLLSLYSTFYSNVYPHWLDCDVAVTGTALM